MDKDDVLSGQVKDYVKALNASNTPYEAFNVYGHASDQLVRVLWLSIGAKRKRITSIMG